ncbi:MAG TPA: hypothetical protein VFR70_02005 [Flavobacterium sp.]|nr:hypothetical protein [Flavobacterium sp.]
MDTDNSNREDQPRNINPKEVNKEHPAKEIKSRDKIDIKESEIGRETSQQPADEHVEGISQIDKGTKQLQDKKNIEKEKSESDK